mmetsp:Transcript_123017/g.244849  ORF Transcript_123017/g.244849 Transcript_123017/m.244849 type:complete len:122 (-) Transcript_123017:23-388(-)
MRGIVDFVAILFFGEPSTQLLHLVQLPPAVSIRGRVANEDCTGTALQPTMQQKTQGGCHHLRRPFAGGDSVAHAVIHAGIATSAFRPTARTQLQAACYVRPTQQCCCMKIGRAEATGTKPT